MKNLGIKAKKPFLKTQNEVTTKLMFTRHKCNLVDETDLIIDKKI